MSNADNIAGIDIGGTNIHGGILNENILSGIFSRNINPQKSSEDVLEELYSFTDKLVNNKCISAIGIGVPGLVESEKGIVYDVVNIPSWKEISLKKLMEDRYMLPVFINNDANCFALGELYSSKWKGYNSLIGLTIGTGLGSGIILNGHLYTGSHYGAGEFGMIDYLDKYIEYYASGQFFKNVYNVDGLTIFKLAQNGDRNALKMFSEMGTHLGNAIKIILYSLDIKLIIIGGSVRYAFPYFKEAMWQRIRTFAFKKAVDDLEIHVSDLTNSGILGAAALCFENI